MGDKREMGDLSRRAILGAALAAPAAGLRAAGIIAGENRKPGALDWQLTNIRLDKTNGYRTKLIEGYCSHQSIEAGGKLRFMVSTNPAARFTIEVFRTGYYGGRGARHMTTLGPLSGKTQPDPPVAARRLRECVWEPSAEITIPADWPSGVYLGRISRIPESRNEHAWQSWVVFIVRDRR